MINSKNEMASRVYVDGLGEEANENMVAEIFSTFGPLNQVCVSNRPPWKALVLFKDNKHALEAIRCLNRTIINGRQVRVFHSSEFPKNQSTKVTVDGLSKGVNEKKVEDAFAAFCNFGRLLQVWVARQPPWIAYVYFEDCRDAMEAIRCLDGAEMHGKRISVQIHARKPLVEIPRLYVGRLGGGVDELEIEETLSAFGRIKHLWIGSDPPVNANVFFEDDEDAIEASRCLDMTMMNGRPVRVLMETPTSYKRDSTRIYVAGLHENVEKKDLEKTFKSFGRITDVTITKQTASIAFITFENEEDAKKAMWCLDGTLMNGRTITLKLARRRSEKERDKYSRVYVSGLDDGTTKADVEKAFKAYGRLKHVWLPKQPLGIAYVFFDNFRDAERAVRYLEGKMINNRRITVKLTTEIISKNEGNGSKVYVTGLAEGTQERDIEKVFKNVGRVKQVWVARQQPGMAVVFFEDARDAGNAIKSFDGMLLNGNLIRVTSSKEMPSRWKSSRIYVGYLGEGADTREIEETFSAFGPLNHVWISRYPEGFALVFFENEKDATRATRCLDGTYVNGNRVYLSQTFENKWRRWKLNEPVTTKRFSISQVDLLRGIDRISPRESSAAIEQFGNLETKSISDEDNEKGNSSSKDGENLKEEGRNLNAQSRNEFLGTDGDRSSLNFDVKPRMEKASDVRLRNKPGRATLAKPSEPFSAPKCGPTTMTSLSSVSTASPTPIRGTLGVCSAISAVYKWYIFIVIIINFALILMMIYM